MHSDITLAMLDGVQVVVPDSLNLITPYVLLEQQDWFEDEIKFLRRLLQSGQQIIDIGANYGVYTLSMARTVGPAGRVWAFEPATETARRLAASIAANGFEHIVLERYALSHTTGSARLSLNDNAELNALQAAGPAHADTGLAETVTLTTLDACLERYGWQNIDFLKIDAEGEEANILRGGERFFDTLSPLVQYEIKAGARIELTLVERFAERGYRSYRLVPALDLLVPFEASEAADGYLLNLFACKPDRAQRLGAQGRLFDPLIHSLNAHPASTDDVPTCADAFDVYRALTALPYGAALAAEWASSAAAPGRDHVEQALENHARSRDPAATPGERYVALKAAFDGLRALCGAMATPVRLASLARVAAELGERAKAVQALALLNRTILQSPRFDVSEPFLAPMARFDALAIDATGVGNWLFAGALEQQETLGAYSSFYSGVAARERLEMIGALGYAGPDMARRLALLRKRFGLPPMS